MKRLLPFAVVAIAFGLGACEKTASQKVEERVEDAGQNMEQGAERAGEKVEDATK
jgi:predicted small secreted protein